MQWNNAAELLNEVFMARTFRYPNKWPTKHSFSKWNFNFYEWVRCLHLYVHTLSVLYDQISHIFYYYQLLSYYIKIWIMDFSKSYLYHHIFCECVENTLIPIACKILSNKKISAINSAALSNNNGNHVINFINKISFGNISNSRKRNKFFIML